MANVKCFFCGQAFNKDKEPYVKVNARRYAHESCASAQDSSILQKEKDKEQFFEMVKKIYGSKYNFVMINRQAEDYIKKYNYTWSGMTGCLHWFYNINHGNLENGNGGIGIIPYIYDKVRDYYQNLYNVKQKNNNQTIQLKYQNFYIPPPKFNTPSPKLMNLDEEKNENY